MAAVDLEIGGRRYQLACRDGGEERLRALGRTIDGKVAEAQRSVGQGSEARALLVAALLLADELDEARAASAAADAEAEAGVAAVERYADRLEALASGLEKAAGDA